MVLIFIFVRNSRGVEVCTLRVQFKREKRTPRRTWNMLLWSSFTLFHVDIVPLRLRYESCAGRSGCLFFPGERESVYPRDSVLDIAFAPESAGCVRTGSLPCVRSKTSNWKQIQLESPPPPARICWVQANTSHSKSMNSTRKKDVQLRRQRSCRVMQTRDFISNKIYRAEISEMRSSSLRKHWSVQKWSFFIYVYFFLYADLENWYLLYHFHDINSTLAIKKSSLAFWENHIS